MRTTNLALALFAFIAVSCVSNINRKNGSGNVVTETRSVQDFNSIEVDSGIEVQITQSDKFSVEVSADDNIVKHVSTNVSNGVLKISIEKFGIVNAETLNVKVSMPEIMGIKASGGSSVSATGKLQSENLDLKSESGSEIKLEIEADRISCSTSSGSSARLSGKALTLELSSSSGSDLDATNLMANDVVAKSSSGSSIDVRPIVSLEAEASSGSSIDYVGNPQNIRRKENSGGSISANH